jgi:Xaa-Pro aminopeptidase
LRWLPAIATYRATALPPHAYLLLAGMVFTIEPAFSVPEEQINIRFEDLIVVTETQADMLSDFLPMDVESIEKLMREPGLLQRCPRSEMMK